MDRWIGRVRVAQKARRAGVQLLEASELADELQMLKVSRQLLELAVQVGELSFELGELPRERARREEEGDCPF